MGRIVYRMRMSGMAALAVFLLVSTAAADARVSTAAADARETQLRALQRGTEGTSSKVVSVGTSALRYGPGETVVVTVRNGLAVPITAMTGRTSCSIVSLDRRSDGAWAEVRNCYSGVPPESVRIGAGRMVRVRLPDRLEPGMYRARLEYQARGRAARAFSRPVRVG